MNLLRYVRPEETGTIRTRHVRCGKPNCACKEGKLHGPYYYHVYWVPKGEGMAKVTRYVPEGELEALKATIEASGAYTKAAFNSRLRQSRDIINLMQDYVNEGAESNEES